MVIIGNWHTKRAHRKGTPKMHANCFYSRPWQDVYLLYIVPKENANGIDTIKNWHTKGHTDSFYPISCKDIKDLYPDPN
jgi:hypothetical protein